MIWPWTHHARDPEPDPEAEAAEEQASALEQRAEVAEQSLRAYLRFRRDPWTGPVLSTIHGTRGRHER
jgi:hypothetical protein